MPEPASATTSLQVQAVLQSLKQPALETSLESEEMCGIAVVM